MAPNFLACAVEPIMILWAVEVRGGGDTDEFLGLSDTHVRCGKWFVNIGRETGCRVESTWTGGEEC